jgi:hypothetical protein
MPSPTSCADIFFVSSAYEKLKQNERSIDLKNKILGQECSKSPRNHILLQARVHLSLAEYHQRNNNTTKTKDHINAFFYLWKTPDPDLALSKRAIQIKESL